jgi:hypothetical protein
MAAIVAKATRGALGAIRLRHHEKAAQSEAERRLVAGLMGDDAAGNRWVRPPDAALNG